MGLLPMPRKHRKVSFCSVHLYELLLDHISDMLDKMDFCSVHLYELLLLFQLCSR